MAAAGGEEIFGFSGEDVGRIGEAVSDYETRPGRRPVAQAAGGAIATGTVCAVEILSGPVAGKYVVKLLYRKPSGAYVELSPVTVTLEDMNAV